MTGIAEYTTDQDAKIDDNSDNQFENVVDGLQVRKAIIEWLRKE